MQLLRAHVLRPPIPTFHPSAHALDAFHIAAHLITASTRKFKESIAEYGTRRIRLGACTIKLFIEIRDRSFTLENE